MNVYTEWVTLNNAIDRELSERLQKSVATNEKTEKEVRLENHNILVEYWRLSRELSLFMNINFEKEIKEHFAGLYVSIESSPPQASD